MEAGKSFLPSLTGFRREDQDGRDAGRRLHPSALRYLSIAIGSRRSACQGSSDGDTMKYNYLLAFKE